MDSTRRGNYDSGQDYVLEYGELRFTFNERDFSERVEQAAVKLGFVAGRLQGTELEDLVNLTVNGEVQDPASGLGEHVNDCWPELVGPADRSLVHWLRRLVFRSAWLDQRVKEGELEPFFDEDTHSFGYAQPERDSEPVELSAEPSWATRAPTRSRPRARRPSPDAPGGSAAPGPPTAAGTPPGPSWARARARSARGRARTGRSRRSASRRRRRCRARPP